MKNSQDENYERRARIGVGASLGVLVGAVFAELFFSGILQIKILGIAIGAGVGAAVGSRIKSRAFQFLWIEYSKAVAQRLIISVFLFLAPFFLYVYFLTVGANPAIEIVVLAITVFGGLFLIYSVGYVISQLDDLLRKILLEAIALGFGLSLFVFLALGLISLAFPIQIPSTWLIAFIIMLACMLVGRLVVAAKYR